MYSVILMTTLAATTAAPNWHRGQCSCPPVYNSCSCYGGYAGYSCYPGYSCYGGYAGYAPVQGYGAAGGCYGYHGGCYGAFGNTYADPYGGCTGCYGCYGGHSCYGVPVPFQAVVPIAPGARVPARDPFPAINPKKDGKDPEEIPKLKEKEKEPKKPAESVKARVKVRIEVPVSGKLFVDGRHINVAPGVRVFQTPPLAAGETYFYDVRIEVEQHGVIRREEQRVIIQPGQDAIVSFPSLRPAGADTARARR
jgi:uncharacterized protein (TIGR03000 family)